jgi:hypothetical protein
MLYVTKVTRLNLTVFGKSNIVQDRFIPFLNQSAIFVSNAARQGTPANAWACLGRRRLPQHMDIYAGCLPGA